MATIKKDGLPDFWASGIAKALVGSQPCLLQPWLKGRYKIHRIERDDSALTRWKIRHTEQLTKATEKFRAEGWKCTVSGTSASPARRRS